GATTDRNYVINTKTVSQGAATITLDTLDGLTINADNNSTVNTFDVQSATAALPLTLNGGIGTDTVTISDSNFTKGQTYAFDAGKLTRTQPAGGKLQLLTMELSHSGVEKMVVNSGSGADTFKMSETDQPDLTFNAGPGIDTLDYSVFQKNVDVNLFA